MRYAIVLLILFILIKMFEDSLNRLTIDFFSGVLIAYITIIILSFIGLALAIYSNFYKKS